MSYLGVDLHTNSFTVCYQSCQGKQRIGTFDIRRIDSFRKTLRKQDKVAVEATGNTGWFVERIRERVSKVIVVDPHQFEVIRRSVKKTDSSGRPPIKLMATYHTAYLLRNYTPENRMRVWEDMKKVLAEVGLPVPK